MKRAEEFVSKCRRLLESDSNLFWVAFQSNVLADVSGVDDDFKKAFEETKKGLSQKGWILPTLHSNMRNQVNIANINVESGTSLDKMQSSVNQLPAASSVVGEVPVLFKVRYSDWDTKKEQVLKHAIELIEQKNKKNIVILYDDYFDSKDLEKIVKNIIRNKTIVSYPSLSGDKTQSVANVINFSVQSNHILVTKNRYFNGCEACSLIFLTGGGDGTRNCLMRAVQNLITIQLGGSAKITGMKEDNTFY